MSEPKWTAGPWLHASSAGGWDAVYGPNNEMICRLALNCPANATLIAAAPELYAAMVQCETVMMIVQPRSHTREYLACLDQARAALAKARGETPEPTDG